MVRHRIGALETLGHAVEAQRLLWVLCRRCGHTQRFDPRHLMALKGDLTLKELQRQLRCQRCRRQRAAVITSDEGWPRRD